IFFFFQAEDGIRDWSVTGVQTCALPISLTRPLPARRRRAMAFAWRIIPRAHLARTTSSFGFCASVSATPPAKPWMAQDWAVATRSEERRVGKEGRSRGWRAH